MQRPDLRSVGSFGKPTWRRLLSAVVSGLLACGPAGEAVSGGVTAGRVEYIMGTMLDIRVEALDHSTAARAVDTAFAVVNQLDSLLSNYKPDSDLSRLVAAAPEPVAVGGLTFEFVQRTLALAKQTDGAFDPTIGSAVALWGFYSGDYRIPDTLELRSVMATVGYQHVRLDESARTVALDSGVQFDPGGTGKGFALEQAIARLQTMELISVYFDFGGQVYRSGADTIGIAVQHPRDDSLTVSEIYFSAGSVATSGDYERFFDHDGSRYSHILDGRTGQPVPNRYSVSVYAPDPWTADALSTVLYVLGPDQSTALLKHFPGAGALYILNDADAWVVGADSVWRTLESR